MRAVVLAGDIIPWSEHARDRRKSWINLGDSNEIRPRRIFAKRRAIKSCWPPPPENCSAGKRGIVSPERVPRDRVGRAINSRARTCETDCAR